MPFKKIKLLLLSYILLGFGTSAQKLNSYIVFLNKDTVLCKNIQHKTSSNGRLTYLNYTTLTGEQFEYKNRFQVPKLDCFHYQDQTFEMIPRRSFLKNKRNIVGKRLVDGKISYCYFNNVKFITGAGLSNSASTSGFKLRYIKFKDGTSIKLTRRSMRKKLKPVLKACEAFKQEYKGNYKLTSKLSFMDFGYTGFTDILVLYNRLCP